MELHSQPSVIPLYIACLLKQPNNLEIDKLKNLSDLTLSMKNIGINGKQLNKFKTFFGLYPKHEAVPITFLHLLVFRPHLKFMLTKQLPFPVLGLVHMYNEIISHKDVFIDDRVNIQISISDIKQTNKGIEITLHSKIYRGRCLVWESFSGYLNPVRKKGTGKPTLKRLNMNNTYERQQKWGIPSNLGRLYARLSGDANPIHLCGLTAKFFGFKQAIAHGMCMAFKCSAALESLSISSSNRLSRLSIHFNKPVYLPSEVMFNYNLRSTTSTFSITSGQSRKPLLTGELSYKDDKPINSL